MVATVGYRDNRASGTNPQVQRQTAKTVICCIPRLHILERNLSIKDTGKWGWWENAGVFFSFTNHTGRLVFCFVLFSLLLIFFLLFLYFDLYFFLLCFLVLLLLMLLIFFYYSIRSFILLLIFP